MVVEDEALSLKMIVGGGGKVAVVSFGGSEIQSRLCAFYGTVLVVGLVAPMRLALVAQAPADS